MNKEQIKALRDEFYIHFKSDEFGFLEVFIDDLLEAQKQELREKIRKIVDKADVPNWNAEDVSNAFNQLKEI